MNKQIEHSAVLVIEDNPADRRLAEIALTDGARETQSTCDILIAPQLGDGIRILNDADGKIDAILLDLHLPDSVGLEALYDIREISSVVPIIILTGSADLSVAADALKQGATDYLEKGEMQARTLWRAIRYAIERKKSEATLQLLANTDPLTGLHNRRAFFQDMEIVLDQANRSERTCAVILLDVDNFKQINDLHGHATGDELLKEISTRVRSQLRKTDIVGRLGGDEFAIVAPNLKSADGAIEIAEKIGTAVSEIKTLGEAEVTTSVSIGIAVFPTDKKIPNDLIECADTAMYKSKKARGGSINFYDKNMDDEIKANHVIKSNMLSDIALGKFHLEYQPIVDSAAFVVTAAEGLARWRDPDGNIVAPHAFIPIAEETGWICALGSHLLGDACAQIRQAIQAGEAIVPISLNVSGVQCRDQSFALRLVEVIMKAEVDPRLINVEITESTIIENVKMARQNFEHLKEVGIGVHIDDFGTGYSSLSVLKDLPLDVLKVDQSFVSEMDQDAGARQIVEAIADLSRKLGFKTIAEGVETESQALLLRSIGIDCLQGFYFSRPVDIVRLRNILAAGGSLAGGSDMPMTNGFTSHQAQRLSPGLG